MSSESAFSDDQPLGVIQQCCAQCSLSLKHTLSRLVCPGFGRHRGNYLITLYLLVKLLYVANAVGQLYMLNSLLGASYHTYGADVIGAMMNGTDWIASPMFPRVTLCDFRVRLYTNTTLTQTDIDRQTDGRRDIHTRTHLIVHIILKDEGPQHIYSILTFKML